MSGIPTMRFPLIRPVMPPPDAWLGYLQPAYDRRYYTNFGPAERQLSQRITERFCAPGCEAVLTTSATAGLTAALLALDIHGTVAVPAFTFPATLQAVLAAGCTPCWSTWTRCGGRCRRTSSARRSPRTESTR